MFVVRSFWNLNSSVRGCLWLKCVEFSKIVLLLESVLFLNCDWLIVRVV